MQPNKSKQELLSVLKDSGLQAELKTHLRSQICEKLKQRNMLREQASSRDSFQERVMVSLIAQLLASSDYAYSLSVYCVESGYEDGLLTRKQIAQIMNLNNDKIPSKCALLQQVLQQQYPFKEKTVKSTQVQTNPEEAGYSIEQRLMLVDQTYRLNAKPGHAAAPQWSQIAKVKQDCEAKLRKQYEKDLNRFKQFELHRVKVHLADEWHQKYEAYSFNLENEYRRRLDNLRKKEKLLHEEYIMRQKHYDQKMGEAEKLLRQKMELLSMKNITVEAQMKNLADAIKIGEEESARKSKAIAEKIREHDSLSLGLQQKINYEVNLAKLALQQEYQEKEAKFLQRKRFVDEEYSKLMVIQETNQLVNKENQRLARENEQLREELAMAYGELRNSVSEITNRTSRIECLKDEGMELKESKAKLEGVLLEEEKKRKRLENEIIALRKELEQYRGKEEIKESQMPTGIARNTVGAMGKSTSDLTVKLESLRQERRKDIEKFKMQI